MITKHVPPGDNNARGGTSANIHDLLQGHGTSREAFYTTLHTGSYRYPKYRYYLSGTESC